MSLMLISAVETRSVENMHLGSTLQLAPTLLQPTTGHIPRAISHGATAGVGGRAGGGVLATQTGCAVVVAVHGVAGTTTADVVDGGGLAQITFEFFIEAEDGTLAAAVDVAGSAAAGDEGCWDARVETG